MISTCVVLSVVVSQGLVGSSWLSMRTLMFNYMPVNRSGRGASPLYFISFVARLNPGEGDTDPGFQPGGRRLKRALDQERRLGYAGQ